MLWNLTEKTKSQVQFSAAIMKHNKARRVFASLDHMVPNRNFAASAVLACTAGQNHWKMRKEVVDDRTALDAGESSTIGTGKYEQTFENQWDEHTKPPNQAVNSTVNSTLITTSAIFSSAVLQLYSRICECLGL